MDRIRPLEEGCGCAHVASVYIQFPDGSLRRPDIALFCREPEEVDEAIPQIPQVRPRTSRSAQGSTSPRGYKDVVVFDPYTPLVLHLRKDRVERHISPVTLRLEGCELTV